MVKEKLTKSTTDKKKHITHDVGASFPPSVGGKASDGHIKNLFLKKKSSDVIWKVENVLKI